MANLHKTKLTRLEINALWVALEICKLLDVPSKFKYACWRNQGLLQSEREATRAAFPEPDMREYYNELSKVKGDKAKTEEVESRFKDLVEKHKQWQKDIEPHMSESVEVEIYQVELPEIDDTVNIPQPGVSREAQNSELVHALMPIIKE